MLFASGLARGGGERLEGGSEEERVRTAFGNPADQSCGILPQRQRERERDWKKEKRRERKQLKSLQF